jgi:large subunit ribosomal protein L5
MPMSQEIQSNVHPMKKISISKVVVNIGVGKSGEPLERAKQGLEELTGQQPTTKRAKNSVRDFGIHKGEPIAAVVTLRNDAAISFLRRVIAAKGNNLESSSFDAFGNLSLGIREHIDLPDTKYNPDIGIFGMDVSIALTRPGYSIAKRRNPKIIGQHHRVTRTEAIQFFREQFGVNIV